MRSDPNANSVLYDDLPLHWQVTRWEKLAFGALLARLRPAVAIEVGTYRGGSLQVIAANAERVYSFDIVDRSAELAPRFRNVEFITGDSHRLLPELLDRIQGQPLGFVLIDGDHSAAGVQADIEAVLRYRPTVPLHVICHDSFNPDCRAGMLAAPWRESPHVHAVEVDWVPGVYHSQAFDTAQARSMWSGFLLAELRPEPRVGPLEVREGRRAEFEAVRAISCHRPSPLRHIVRQIRRAVAGQA